MPHVMFGGLVHEPALTLAQRLVGLLGPGDLDRVFFSDSGSVAVEVALKMAVQYWRNQGRRAAPVSSPSAAAITATPPAPWRYPTRRAACTRRSAGCCRSRSRSICRSTKQASSAFETALERHADELAAIIVEPLVQGAGGMRFHDAQVLRTLRAAADRYELLLIFDEIFTGFGRTGAMFAFQAAGVVPDIITLSKALTGGTLPLAATIAGKKVFEAFWSDDPSARADARPDLHGEPARLRRRQCLARSVRARAAARSGRQNLERAGGGSRTVSQAPGRQGRAGQRRHRRGRIGPHRGSQRPAATLCCGRRFYPAVRHGGLSHAGLHHRRGRAWRN